MTHPPMIEPADGLSRRAKAISVPTLQVSFCRNAARPARHGAA